MQSSQPTVVIIDGNSSINYLIQRYAERIGYSMEIMPASVFADVICDLWPVAVIFHSVESLENSQPLVAELTNCDIPIIVCSSMGEQIRTRELGADYGLLHPLIYDDFCTILEALISQNTHRSGDVE